MKVAIDGPAGCGKSTIARMIADNLGFLYINSGNLYRAVAFLSIRENTPWRDAPGMIALMKRHSFDYHPDGSVIVDNVPLLKELRSSEVDAIVSQVSAIPEIRQEVNAIIRQIADSRNVVSEGRDITTVVFPNAELKIYLDASEQVRAERRYQEKLNEQMHISNHATLKDADGNVHPSIPSIEDIKNNIEMRDRLDKEKAVGALKIAKDAEYLDTSDLTIAQVYEKVYKTLMARIAHGRK